jgi:hypothetical protein
VKSRTHVFKFLTPLTPSVEKIMNLHEFRVFICQSLADQRIPDGRNFHAALTELFKITGEEMCRVYAT